MAIIAMAKTILYFKLSNPHKIKYITYNIIVPGGSGKISLRVSLVCLIIVICLLLGLSVSWGTQPIQGDCCLVLVCLGDNHDIISYRRDAEYPADMIIDKMKFMGYDAIHEYKEDGGYFTHLIITEEGWIIGIGGKDNQSINKELEELGGEIVSKKRIEEENIKEANSILRENQWGFFIIKSSDGKVGLTAYDGRIEANTISILNITEGEYVKVTNNPNCCEQGNFKEFDHDPTEAALKIAATDPYGLHRRDIITYEYNQGKVMVWASFDGGKLLEGAMGSPDNIKFLGHEISGKKLPVVPNKKFLGNETLPQEKPGKQSMTPTIIIMAIIATFILIFTYKD